MAQVNIRIDDDLKEKAEDLFEELGLNMTTAFNMFVRQTVREGGIPFEITTKVAPIYNDETIEAMQEIEEMKSGKRKKHPQTVKSLFKELKINVDR